MQTTAGALKALVESLGLGLAAYRDRATQGAKPPYVELTEEVALAPDVLETGGGTVVETCQLDLYQPYRDKDPASSTYGHLMENYALAPALKRGVHNARLVPVGGSLVYTVLWRHSMRLLEEQENLVHHAVTLDVWRQQ
jgi:hypothetical protein